MNQTKGMSQTLALIVAASVLMMTALTVIFLAQGALGDFGEDSNVQSCIQSVRAQCQAALSTTPDGQTATIDTPATCVTQTDSGEQLVSGVESSSAVQSTSGTDTITCATN